MNRRALIATVGVAFTGGCAGLGSDADSESSEDLDEIRSNADAVVTMTRDPSFEPRVVEIERGETVAWINETPRPQSVTAYEDRIPEDADYFASGGFGRETIASVLYPLFGAVRRNEAFRHTFETPGVYEYYSIPSEHLGMDGRVVVE